MSNSKGVAFNAPPPHLIADARRVLEQMTAQLPVGTNGAVIVMATDLGLNAAVVHRVGKRFAVGSWIGKESGWGSRFTGGGAVQATW